MNSLLAFGLTFGALAGAAHAYGLLRAHRRRADADIGSLAAVELILWTVGLWMLFGTYVLSLWLLATLVYAGTRMWQLMRSTVR